jgi:hypothetical protein
LYRNSTADLGLVLGRRGDVALDGEVIQELLDVLGGQLAGMALAGEQNVPPDPVDVGLLGAERVMQGANARTDLVEEARGGWRIRRGDVVRTNFGINNGGDDGN